MVGLMANSKRIYTKEDIPRKLLPVPTSLSEPLLTHASTEGSPTLAGSFRSVFYGVTMDLGAPQILFVPSKTGVSVSPSPVEEL